MMWLAAICYLLTKDVACMQGTASSECLDDVVSYSAKPCFFGYMQWHFDKHAEFVKQCCYRTYAYRFA